WGRVAENPSTGSEVGQEAWVERLASAPSPAPERPPVVAGDQPGFPRQVPGSGSSQAGLQGIVGSGQRSGGPGFLVVADVRVFRGPSDGDAAGPSARDGGTDEPGKTVVALSVLDGDRLRQRSTASVARRAVGQRREDFQYLRAPHGIDQAWQAAHPDSVWPQCIGDRGCGGVCGRL